MEGLRLHALASTNPVPVGHAPVVATAPLSWTTRRHPPRPIMPDLGIVSLLEERVRNGGMTDLARLQAAIWTQVSWRQTRKALARARRY